MKPAAGDHSVDPRPIRKMNGVPPLSWSPGALPFDARGLPHLAADPKGAGGGRSTPVGPIGVGAIAIQ